MSFFKCIIRGFFSITGQFFLLSILSGALKILTILNNDQESHYLSKEVHFQNSSVACSNDLQSNKLCFFKYVYFIKNNQTSQSFVFMLDKYSLISGLVNRNDLKIINLSAIKNHPKMFMDIIMVDGTETANRIFSHLIAAENIQIIRKDNLEFRSGHFISTPPKNINKLLEVHTSVFHQPIFVISRFKCDNLMHVLHDDLLPLFITYYHLCEGDIDRCTAHYQLFLLDKCTSHEFLELYKIFSVREPLISADITGSKSTHFSRLKKILLFKTLRAGLDTSSVWFNYGFTDRQGPMKDVKIDSVILEKFCNFIIQKLKIKVDFIPKNQINIVILNRKINRKIINILELKERVKTKSSEIFQRKICVVETDLFNNTVQNLITQILKADIIIGMHSSTMILTIFNILKRRTLIFELFPFGIQPEYVSFLYPLKEILSPQIILKFWKNQNEENSVTHPNNDKLFGGLQHLPLSEQKNIIATKLIPPVKCCHDPAYLFRMYQDTRVGEKFLKFYLSGIQEFNDYAGEKSKEKKWFFPTPVFNVRCLFKNSEVLIEWEPPKNTVFYTVKYKIAISVQESNLLAFIVDENKLILGSKYFESSKRPLKLSIWIKSVVLEYGEIDSSDTYTVCAEEDRMNDAKKLKRNSQILLHL
ncbi:protein O-linked-mannose beta-1,4-N-acetylglucosaminyltransferase 2-like [Bemisia tabaci]|uniref:protein O-linked-mannose beta-1,4-N-acetylglucosaminyltransferase 2-like n=1 Tax=Bemisia tabaci TaxID=7038 RepID=UPI003B287C26